MNKKNIIVALLCVFAVSEVHAGWKHFFGGVLACAVALKSYENRETIKSGLQTIDAKAGGHVATCCEKVSEFGEGVKQGFKEADAKHGGYCAAGYEKASWCVDGLCYSCKVAKDGTVTWFTDRAADVEEKGFGATCKEQVSHLGETIGTGIKNTDAKFGGYGAQVVVWSKTQLAKLKKSNDEQSKAGDVSGADA